MRLHPARIFMSARWFVVLVTAISFVFAPLQQIVHAAPLKGFDALQVSSSGSGTFIMKPGEVKPFTIQFKNIGAKAWANSGPGYVSIYTYEPKYRTSAFVGPGWKTSIQPTVMKELSRTFGEVGTITFDLKAPTKTGTYKETFNLAADDIAWIPGGLFTVNIVVEDPKKAESVASAPMINPTPLPTPQTPPTQPVTTSPSGLSAFTLIRSSKKVTAKGGEVVDYTVGIKNTGTVAWNRGEIRVPDVAIASVSLAADTRHTSWLSTNVLVASATQIIQPGSLEYFAFKFKAPKLAGTHTVRYVFAANNTVIPDFSVDIPVEVTENSKDAFDAPIVNPLTTLTPPTTLTTPVSFSMTEPMLRVGILIVDGETNNEVTISCASDWKLVGGDGSLLAEMAAGTHLTALYKTSRYWFDRGNGMEKTNNFLRFVPNEPNAICTVENWDRRNRGSDRPYNRYHNILELRHNDKKERTWLINELPMELYLKGLGETSNISHMEYQKALITAARTYATYHFERGTKRAAEFFHITGYADDQVYRGYDQEAQSPRIVQSVNETRGVTVTIEGRTAITPYFSRSDGRTRDWSEVWGGTVSWLVGKPAPCDKEKGFKLWGHGVGMSAMEALCMANRGQGWEQILNYFYTGIQLTRRWE